jgi:hypothetical protein
MNHSKLISTELDGEGTGHSPEFLKGRYRKVIDLPHIGGQSPGLGINSSSTDATLNTRCYGSLITHHSSLITHHPFQHNLRDCVFAGVRHGKMRCRRS